MLSELPISDSLSVSASLNRSLLFHPRVAEEANNLLATRDDALTAQLVAAIEQTNSDSIELRDQYPQPTVAANGGSPNDGPPLLQAIHSCRPNVFQSPYNPLIHQMFSSAVTLGAGTQQQQQQQQQKLSEFWPALTGITGALVLCITPITLLALIIVLTINQRKITFYSTAAVVVA